MICRLFDMEETNALLQAARNLDHVRLPTHSIRECYPLTI